MQFNKGTVLLICLGLSPASLDAHLREGHSAPTYQVSPARQVEAGARKLQLEVLDAVTGTGIAARFSLRIDGADYTPPFLNQNGLRFETIHRGKEQRFTATYSRGSGPVEVPLPEDASKGVVCVTRGYEYVAAEIPFEITPGNTRVVARMRRWSSLRERGWLPADGHLHFERTQPANDEDWLTMLDGDDLTHAHFLVLKGGNLPGIWADQFAYGKPGEARDAERLIRPGEEYRDQMQGHINLLGIREIIDPISTGGIGEPAVPFNYPTFFEILTKTRQLGGIGGPAHGTALGACPTGILDTILGAVDFFEISNTHMHFLDVWYHLMNCGYSAPPSGGTDLPNNPYRDSWQPLLGETRMYVRMNSGRDFESWKRALRRGEVFVSSGPMVEFTVDGVGPGGTVRLPAGGGVVTVEAKLSSPFSPLSLEVVCNGKPVRMESGYSFDGEVHRQVIQERLEIRESSWLAARGYGRVKQALQQNTGLTQRTFAHTAGIRVLVGSKPILVQKDADWLLSRLREQKDVYSRKGKYPEAEHKVQVLELFNRAIDEIRKLQFP